MSKLFNKLRQFNFSSLGGFFFVLSIFAAVSGRTFFWSDDFIEIFPSGSRFVLFCVVGVALALCFCLVLRKKLDLLNPNSIFLLFPFLLLVDFLNRKYSFFAGPSIKGEIIIITLTSLLIFFKGDGKSINLEGGYFKYLLFFTVIILLFGFYSQTGLFDLDLQRVIFSDDHPVFQYRIDLLRNNFPYIPIYDTSWNAGADTMHLFASGVINSYIIGLPLYYLLPIEISYNFVLVFTSVVLFSFAIFRLAKSLNLQSPCCYLAAILSLSTSLYWYRWVLKYGTLGFVTSVVLLIFSLPLIFKLFFQKPNFTWFNAITLTLYLSLSFCWLPIGIIIVPLLIFSLFQAKSLLLNKKAVFVLIFTTFLTLPWLTVFWSGWNLSGFVTAEKNNNVEKEAVRASPSKNLQSKQEVKDRVINKGVSHSKEYKTKVKKDISLKSIARKVKNQSLATNPIIFFLSIPAILFWLRGVKFRSKSFLYILLIIWSLILGFFIAPFKPQLELDRFILIGFIFLSIPVSTFVVNSLGSFNDKRIISIINASFFNGFLLAGVLSTYAIFSNRSIERYFFRNDSVEILAKKLNSDDTDGRVLFSGFVLHDLSNGHVAPLSYLTNRKFIASSHMHNLWKRVDVFPHEFVDRGYLGIIDYLDVMNVSLVLAHEPFWRDYFSKKPDDFDLISKETNFFIFRRKNYKSNYFYSGNGSILEQGQRRIVLTLDSSVSNAVIKFRYVPSLKVSGCEVIAPYSVADSIDFIELKSCNHGNIVISSKTFFERLMEALP